MPSPTTIQGSVWEDGNAALMARVVNAAGDNIQQAELSTITYSVFDQHDQGTVVTGHNAQSLTIANVIFDTLQTADPRWTVDTTGYNFLHAIAATAFPNGDRHYRVEYKLTETGGAVTWLVFKVWAARVNTS